jgi:hypothetical protein
MRQPDKQIMQRQKYDSASLLTQGATNELPKSQWEWSQTNEATVIHGAFSLIYEVACDP